MDEPLEQAEVRFPLCCVRSVDVSVHAKPDNWEVTALLWFFVGREVRGPAAAPQVEDTQGSPDNHRHKKEYTKGKGKCYNYSTISKNYRQKQKYINVVPEPLLLWSYHIISHHTISYHIKSYTKKKINSQPQTPLATLTHLREESTPELSLWNSQCRGRLTYWQKYFYSV